MKQGSPGGGLMPKETVSMLALRCSRRRTRASAAAPGAGALPSFLKKCRWSPGGTGEIGKITVIFWPCGKEAGDRLFPSRSGPAAKFPFHQADLAYSTLL
jgi:hypothetical protein